MIKKFFDKDDQQLIAKLAEHYRAIIELIGEDPDREGLLKTPERAAKALIENTMGYSQDAEAVVRSAIFEHPGSEIVVVKDEQTGTRGRDLCTAPASTRTHDRRDLPAAHSCALVARRHCGDQGTAYVHDDARCGETALGHSHHAVQRCFSGC